MPHMIEQFADGTDAFVAAGKPAWHRLGTVYTDRDGIDAGTLLRDAKLAGWQVRAIANPSVIDPVTGQVVIANDQRMILRTNPVTGDAECLGSAGKVWTPIQNEEHCEFLDALAGGGAQFDAGMSLYGGKHVVVTMKVPKSIKIAGTDGMDLYIAVINYHDGHGSFTVLATPVRIVCANTEAMALGNYKRMIKIRHTATATASVEEARRALEMAGDYLDAIEVEAERMINEPLTTGELEKVIDRIWPLASLGKMAATMSTNRRLDIVTLFTEADTQANCRGTRWAGYNAITEYLDHRLAVRGADDEFAARASRSLLGGVDDKKQEAFKMLRVPA